MEGKSKLITVGLIAVGAVVVVQNYSRDGFWVGALGTLLICSAIGFKLSKI